MAKQDKQETKLTPLERAKARLAALEAAEQEKADKKNERLARRWARLKLEQEKATTDFDRAEARLGSASDDFQVVDYDAERAGVPVEDLERAYEELIAKNAPAEADSEE